jgi:hypothetical protein
MHGESPGQNGAEEPGKPGIMPVGAKRGKM